MKVEDVEDKLFPIIKVISGVSDVFVNDYDSESMTFCIQIDRDTVSGNLRTISSALRKKLSKLGISAKKGNLLDWEAPRKRKDRWGDIVIDTDYFMVDFVYAYSNLYLQREFMSEYHIFDKYNFLGNNDPDLEKLFRDSHSSFSCVEDHMDYIEGRHEFAGLYDILPIYKFEHSGMHYETTPSCRFDSGLIGLVAIEKVSKINVSDIVSNINDIISADSYA